MKATWIVVAVSAMAAAVFAGEPAFDPVSVVQRPRGSDTEAHLSPSTQPSTSLLLEPAIKSGLSFLESWQSPNGSWDRLENRDPILNPDPNFKAPRNFDRGPGDMANARKWSSGPYDGPVKDLAENETEHMADTCLSGDAMLHAVTSGRRPEMAPKCRKAIEYVCREVDKWNADTIYIQKRVFDPIHDPHPSEVGDNPSVSEADRKASVDNPGHTPETSNEGFYYDPTVDTFFALRFLAFAKTHTEEPVLLGKIDRALSILVRKIEKCQDKSGAWLDETDPLLGLTSSPNTSTMSVAVRAINFATRQGVAINPKTRQAATEWFIKNALNDLKTHPRALNYDPWLLVAATKYDMYVTSRFLVADAEKRGLRGDSEYAALQERVTHDRSAAEEAMRLVLAKKVIECRGPALECCPDLLAAAWEFAPSQAPEFERKISSWLLPRQQSDGHFIAGYGTWGRGDNTFGTSTTVPTLELIADRQKAENSPPKTP